MKHLKTTVKWIFISIAIICYLYPSSVFIDSVIKYRSLYPSFNDCGIVISKSADEVSIKRGTITELYLNIQFEKSGFESIKVEPTTYFKHKVGERVCFEKAVKLDRGSLFLNDIGAIFITMSLVIISYMLAAWSFFE